MAVRPPSSAPLLGLVADDRVLAAAVLAGRRLVAVLLRVGDVDAHALEEALVTVVVDRDDLVVEQVEQRDRGRLAVELRGGPLADELARPGGCRWRR